MLPPGANSLTQKKKTPLSIQKMTPIAPKNVGQCSTNEQHGRVLAYKPPDVDPDATETSNIKRRNRSRGKKRKSIRETAQDPTKSSALANDQADAMPNSTSAVSNDDSFTSTNNSTSAIRP
jgi:hypothetical protein